MRGGICNIYAAQKKFLSRFCGDSTIRHGIAIPSFNLGWLSTSHLPYLRPGSLFVDHLQRPHPWRISTQDLHGRLRWRNCRVREPGGLSPLHLTLSSCNLVPNCLPPTKPFCLRTGSPTWPWWMRMTWAAVSSSLWTGHTPHTAKSTRPCSRRQSGPPQQDDDVHGRCGTQLPGHQAAYRVWESPTA